MADPNIDLAAVRVQLNKMTDRILMRLHDRSGFPLNQPVYQRGGVELVGNAEASFLELALEGLEAYHALLGRYRYPDQFPLVSSALPDAAAERIVEAAPPHDVTIGLRDDLLPFYIDEVLPRLCAPGEDASTFGETVYIDADTLELLNERIQIGRKVALAKIVSQPELSKLVGRPDELMERLRDRTREEAVLLDVEQRARRYEIEPPLARSVFVWVIEQTIRVEVEFLQRMQGGATGGT